MVKEIYLDCNSTTSTHPEVVKEMNKFMTSNYGNPSSGHKLGEEALKAVNNSRRKIASEINCRPEEIIFTSGGTEANNLTILGIVRANKIKRKNKIIISSIEHSSIYESCMELKKEGYEIVEISVDGEGLINFKELEKKIDDRTLFVSIIHVNNEIGVIQDLRRISEICKQKKVIFHTDAVQSFGKETIKVHDFGIDLLSASAHKINGPKGIGFLYVKNGIEIKPLIVGGGQERGLRGGTENVPGIAGFSKALDLTKNIDWIKIRKNRDYFISKLEDLGFRLNGSKEKRLFNNINVSFKNFDAEMAVLSLSEKGIYCSTKSACLTSEGKESRVLKSIGLKKEEINGTLRFGIDYKIEKKEIDRVVREIKLILEK